MLKNSLLYNDLTKVNELNFWKCTFEWLTEAKYAVLMLKHK